MPAEWTGSNNINVRNVLDHNFLGDQKFTTIEAEE